MEVRARLGAFMDRISSLACTPFRQRHLTSQEETSLEEVKKWASDQPDEVAVGADSPETKINSVGG